MPTRRCPPIDSDASITGSVLRPMPVAENVVPAVQAAVLERWGDELREPLDAVSAALTTEALRRLNRDVVLGGDTPRQAARTWLAQLASA